MIFVKDQTDKGIINIGTEENPQYKTIVLLSLELDTVSDFNELDPTSANYPFSDIFVIQGSDAHVIQDNTIYMMKSDGTWVIQDEASRMNVYTKDETDQLLMDYAESQALVDLNQDGEISENRNYIMDLYGITQTNMCTEVYDITSTTINGVTWTVNANGTITANGTATANSFFYILPANSYKQYGRKIWIYGCPSGGSETTYELQTALGSTVKRDYGGTDQMMQFLASDAVRYIACCVRNGYTADNLLFRPVIETDEVMTLMGKRYDQPVPTLTQLFNMVRSYHP